MDQFSGGGHRRQLERLDNVEAGFREVVQEFRDDEIAHRDAGLARDAEKVPGCRRRWAMAPFVNQPER